MIRDAAAVARPRVRPTCGLHFFINIVLTLVGFLPGLVHALWLVFTDQKG